jgi:HemY protein
MTFLRIIVWFAVVAALMGAAVWLAERPGTITAEWHGWRLDTSVGVVLIVVALLMLLGVALWHAWRWIVGAPSALIEGWGESRRRQGYRALTHGLAAVAAGDASEAQKQARKAEKLLREPPLTLLLSAQAAQLAGDREGAKRAFSTMLDDEQTAFLGLRGLIAQALRDSDPQQAMALAERAFKLRPDTEWVVHSLFDMQAQVGQWRAAQETLDTGIRRKVINAERGRALKALILVERSRAAERDGNMPDALAYSREAFALAPERIAAAACHADLLIKTGDARRAMRTIERAWSLAPHPDLAQLYLKASGEQDPLKRIAVVRRLATQKPDDLESHLALAQSSLDAGLWGEARRHLQTAGGTSPATRVCRMMAEVEERAHSGEAKVREWLARAAAAPADRTWRCAACGAQHESWRPVCESCAAFGTLQWRAPGTFGQLLPPEGPPDPSGSSNHLPRLSGESGKAPGVSGG